MVCFRKLVMETSEAVHGQCNISTTIVERRFKPASLLTVAVNKEFWRSLNYASFLILRSSVNGFHVVFNLEVSCLRIFG